MTELTEKELKRLTDKHYELVVCRGCREWTEYGEACCGYTECDPECPVCIEKGYV